MTSIIHPTASVGKGTLIGEYCVVEKGVVIGADCQIGHHVVIHENTHIGNGVRIDDFASIGKQPMKAANSATTSDQLQPPSRIEDGTIIGSGAVLYAGCTIGSRALIADLSTVREQVKIGERTIIGRGAAIENCCVIGSYSKLETNVYLCAYSQIGDRCFVAPGVITSNDNYAGRTKERFNHFKGVTLATGGRIGAGAVICPGKTISSDGFAAAGSVVTQDVPEKIIVAGVPAKELRPVPPEQWLENQE